MSKPHIRLRADAKSLTAIGDGISHYSGGDQWRACQLRSGDHLIEVGVHSLDVAPLFEVFALDLRIAPLGDTEFDGWSKWPLASWTIGVLTREEFVKPGDPATPRPGQLGYDQTAERPGLVPDEAVASCIVDVGLLFTGERGQRVIVAADWFPYNVLITDEPAKVEAFLASCLTFPVSDYAFS